MATCILYQNADQTITLLDIPRSIEQAQGFPNDDRKHLVSSKAIEKPFPSIEPKSAKALRNLEAISVRNLLLERFISLAREEVQSAFNGAWCFPRVLETTTVQDPRSLERRACDLSEDGLILPSTRESIHENNSFQTTAAHSQGNHPHTNENLTPGIFYRNAEPAIKNLQVGSESSIVFIPPQSSFLLGVIEETSSLFKVTAPQFHLVIMDPPWPNRSARRKQSYKLSSHTPDIAALLSSIPLTEHLAEDALVGVWVTNKPALHDLILGTNGFFEQWGLEFVEEWVWLKVTISGEPICALNSTWRKPYEILLVGRKRGPGTINVELKRRVITSVPDLHSRKPNLKLLLEPLLPSKYEAVEIFARNLTAGWWAWGNEVLKFQSEEHWLDNSNTT
jgi:N6-adenosine-specific RNA methylase IME4